jgi:nickel transport protein
MRMDRFGEADWPTKAIGRTLWLLTLVAVVSLAWAGGAEAHKLKAFATVEGAVVSGYAYFTPGGRAQQADVTITGPGGVEVLKTGVSGQGEFHFVAKQRVDYVITVDGGDSHVATYTIHASDLPDSLPTPEGDKILPLDPPTAATAAAPDAAAPPQPEAQAPTPAPSNAANAADVAIVSVDPASLRAMIRESVAREVNPLREQLDAFQEAVGWRDVVSGLGYIFGLCGVAYGFYSWRRSPAPPAARPAARNAAEKRA